MIQAGEGRYVVFLRSIQIGNDRLVIISGGEEEHIGAVTLMENKQEVGTLVKPGHMDQVISQKTALRIHQAMGEDLLVVCGIHIDHASKEEIGILLENAEICVEQFIKKEKQ